MLFALCAVIAWQDPPTMEIGVSSAGRTAVLEGTIDIPDGAILDVYFRTTSDQLMWNGPPGCSPGAEPDDTFTLYTIARGVDLCEKKRVTVRGGRFSGAFDDVPPGLYTVAIMYARGSQRDEKVVESLGAKHLDWAKEADFAHIDPATLADALMAERARALRLIDQLDVFRDVAESAARGGRRSWHFGSYHRELDAFEKTVGEARSSSFLNATVDGVGQALSILRRWPGAAAPAVAGHTVTSVLPVRRAPEFSRCTLAQEQFLVVMRCAQWAWARDAATWKKTLEASKHFIEAIRAEVPEKTARTPAQERASLWCDRCVQTLDLMAGAKEGGEGDRSAAQAQYDRLAQTLRRIVK